MYLQKGGGGSCRHLEWLIQNTTLPYIKLHVGAMGMHLQNNWTPLTLLHVGVCIHILLCTTCNIPSYGYWFDVLAIIISEYIFCPQIRTSNVNTGLAVIKSHVMYNFLSFQHNPQGIMTLHTHSNTSTILVYPSVCYYIYQL